jgi:hypothetical protein
MMFILLGGYPPYVGTKDNLFHQIVQGKYHVSSKFNNLGDFIIKSSTITMPHPHISTGFPYGCLFTISGAINCGVPILPEKIKHLIISLLSRVNRLD